MTRARRIDEAAVETHNSYSLAGIQSPNCSSRILQILFFWDSREPFALPEKVSHVHRPAGCHEVVSLSPRNSTSSRCTFFTIIGPQLKDIRTAWTTGGATCLNDTPEHDETRVHTITV